MANAMLVTPRLRIESRKAKHQASLVATGMESPPYGGVWRAAAGNGDSCIARTPALSDRQMWAESVLNRLLPRSIVAPSGGGS